MAAVRCAATTMGQARLVPRSSSVAGEGADPLGALDDVCTEFFHHTPQHVKWLAVPLFNATTPTAAGGMLPAKGYGKVVSNGSQQVKEVFVVRRGDGSGDDMPWPIMPSSFEDAACCGFDALKHMAIEDVKQRVEACLNHCTATAVSHSCHQAEARVVMSSIVTWLAKLPWEAESILFARHYHYDTVATDDQGEVGAGEGGRTTMQGAAAASSAAMVDAHTDSGIITVLFAPRKEALTDEFQVLSRTPDGHVWLPPQQQAPEQEEATNGDGAGGGGGGLLVFAGEMLRPLMEHIGERLIPDAMRLSWSSVIASEGSPCVHRVVGTCGAGLKCRHAYAFQLRLPSELLQGRQSRLRHFFLEA